MMENWKKRRGIGLGGLVIIGTILIGGCGISAKGTAEQGSAPATGQLANVKIGLDTAATGSPQFRVAHDQGFFQEHGIETEFSDFPYGIDTINALLINRTEVGSAADYALLNSLGKGDMTIIGTMKRNNEITAKKTVLLVKEDIHGGQDLVGKRLGVARGTVYEYVWARYLEKLNIDSSQVKFVNYSSLDEAVVALQKNEMDAIWATGANLAKLSQLEGVKQLTDISATGVNTRAFIIAQRSFVDKNPETVSKLLKALSQATDYIPSHKEETADILFNTIKLPKEGVLSDLEASDYVLGFSQEDFDELNAMKEWLTDQGLLKDRYDLKSKVNIEPLQKAFPASVTYQP